LPTRLMRRASCGCPPLTAPSGQLAGPVLLTQSDSAAQAEQDASADRPPDADIAVPGQRPAPADAPEGARK